MTITKVDLGKIVPDGFEVLHMGDYDIGGYNPECKLKFDTKRYKNFIVLTKDTLRPLVFLEGDNETSYYDEVNVSRLNTDTVQANKFNFEVTALTTASTAAYGVGVYEASFAMNVYNIGVSGDDPIYGVLASYPRGVCWKANENGIIVRDSENAFFDGYVTVVAILGFGERA